MVKIPVPATLANELPEIVPIKPLANIDAFAGPPLYLPAKAKAKSINAFPPPDTFKKAPNNIKVKINVDVT